MKQMPATGICVTTMLTKSSERTPARYANIPAGQNAPRSLIECRIVRRNLEPDAVEGVLQVFCSSQPLGFEAKFELDLSIIGDEEQHDSCHSSAFRAVNGLSAGSQPPIRRHFRDESPAAVDRAKFVGKIGRPMVDDLAPIRAHQSKNFLIVDVQLVFLPLKVNPGRTAARIQSDQKSKSSDLGLLAVEGPLSKPSSSRSSKSSAST